MKEDEHVGVIDVSICVSLWESRRESCERCRCHYRVREHITGKISLDIRVQ